jgi:hypothetical protein
MSTLGSRSWSDFTTTEICCARRRFPTTNAPLKCYLRNGKIPSYSQLRQKGGRDGLCKEVVHQHLAPDVGSGLIGLFWSYDMSPSDGLAWPCSSRVVSLYIAASEPRKI